MRLGYAASTRPRAAKRTPELPKSRVRRCQRDPKGPQKYPEVHPNHPKSLFVSAEFQGGTTEIRTLVHFVEPARGAERREKQGRERTSFIPLSTNVKPVDAPGAVQRRDAEWWWTPKDTCSSSTSRRQPMDCADRAHPSLATVGQLENNHSWQQGAQSPSL